MKTTKENAASPCQGEAAQQTKLSFDHTARGNQRATLIHSRELRGALARGRG